jgi:hypothetical protein
MKRAKRQEFPPGWNEKKVRAVIAHCDQQTEEAAAAEIETAPEVAGETWVSVPAELVEVVTRLMEDHAKKVARALSRNHTKKSRDRRQLPLPMSDN